MSSISPLTNSNILPPTIPPIGPSLSSESEDEGDKPEKETKNEGTENTISQVPDPSIIGMRGVMGSNNEQMVQDSKPCPNPVRHSRSSTQSSRSSTSSSSSPSTSSSSSSSASGSDSSASDEENVEKGGTKNVAETLKASNAAKEQFRQLKPTFLKFVDSNEKLQQELKRKQKQLLKINLDKYFLFERLLSYEKPPPRKYTKQKSKPQPGSDTVSVEDPSSQNEMSISTPPKVSSKKLQKQKAAEKRCLDNDEESLNVEVDTEEDNEQISGISLLKYSNVSTTNEQQTKQKSGGRKKYKKRRKSGQNVTEKGEKVNSETSLGAQTVPGGTSLLLSSFSSHAPPKV